MIIDNNNSNNNNVLASKSVQKSSQRGGGGIGESNILQHRVDLSSVYSGYFATSNIIPPSPFYRGIFPALENGNDIALRASGKEPCSVLLSK